MLSIAIMRHGVSAVCLSKASASLLTAWSSSRRRSHHYDVSELRVHAYGPVQAAAAAAASDSSSCDIRLHKYELSSSSDTAIGNDELIVGLVAAPINPADMNVMEGQYASLPAQLPSCVGLEGLFQVLHTGAGVTHLSPGDWVVPFGSSSAFGGTWRTHIRAAASHFYKTPKLEAHKHILATLAINPCTAYRMLRDFVALAPGDTVIQNGANSGVGQAVIQLANEMGLNVVNIVRKREDAASWHELVELMGRVGGGQHVYTEEDMRKPALRGELWSRLRRPRLALNCVGGRPTSDMVRLLDKDATLVTYGGMSRQPLMFNTTDFIFKDLTCRGFWITSWLNNKAEATEAKRTQMFDYLCSLVARGKLIAPKCAEFAIRDYANAFRAAKTPQTNTKCLLVP